MLKEMDQAMREHAIDAAADASYIADAIEEGDKILGVRKVGDHGAAIVFCEADGNEVEISVRAILNLADLLRREKVIE